jgi:hypothetical protein
VGSFSIVPIGTYAASANFHQLRDTTRAHAAKLYARAYADARERASAQTGLPLRSFPRSSPYTLEQTLDSKFLPG